MLLGTIPFSLAAREKSRLAVPRTHKSDTRRTQRLRERTRTTKWRGEFTVMVLHLKMTNVEMKFFRRKNAYVIQSWYGIAKGGESCRLWTNSAQNQAINFRVG